jgi:hypothetical protein
MECATNNMKNYWEKAIMSATSLNIPNKTNINNDLCFFLLFYLKASNFLK